MEQELLSLPEHVSSTPVFSGVHVTRSAVLCVCCLFFCTFYFGHCVVSTSSIYRFSLPLWYLQTPFTTFSGLSILNCLCCIFTKDLPVIRNRVSHLFSVLCSPIMCLYVLGSVLWFPHTNDVRFVFTSSCLQEGPCLINVICVCLRIMVSNAHCVRFVFVFVWFLFFVLCDLRCQFLWIVHFVLPLQYSLSFIDINTLNVK